jgi:hypothetical protein
LGLLFLFFLCKEHQNSFQWVKPGYEYNFDTLPFKLIHGTNRWFDILNDIKEGKSKLRVQDFIQKVDETTRESENFYTLSQELHLY